MTASRERYPDYGHYVSVCGGHRLKPSPCERGHAVDRLVSMETGGGFGAAHFVLVRIDDYQRIISSSNHASCLKAHIRRLLPHPPEMTATHITGIISKMRKPRVDTYSHIHVPPSAPVHHAPKTSPSSAVRTPRHPSTAPTVPSPSPRRPARHRHCQTSFSRGGSRVVSAHCIPGRRSRVSFPRLVEGSGGMRVSCLGRARGLDSTKQRR